MRPRAVVTTPPPPMPDIVRIRLEWESERAIAMANEALGTVYIPRQPQRTQRSPFTSKPAIL